MIEQQVQYMLEQDSQLAELTDRDTVEEGDIVNIDYEGKIDGVAFDGGTAKGFDLEIGSGRFIEG
ncbi:MAG: FKBP-type peptidyl-prolyl cis-trans isomerase, partial [Lachnospiraceae bacterium]|nr:FKBP-type peptidyl-prolyl cis-trans isomerase [Lachnospiraceae bacterium]